ncbi:MAG: hypothetical protein Q7R93_04400 [bacterium]|nr:hypothetical protein [bacterium]
MRTNFKQGLPAAHGSAQAGLAPVVIIIIALVVIGGGTFAIKKAADSTKATEEKAKQEQAAKDSAAQAEAAAAAEATKAARVLHIKLDEQNKSGQKGEATITQVGTSTVKVIVNITGKPSGVAQPAHIHLGSCPNPGAVKYPLTSVGKGASQTELPMTLDQLLSELPLAINVHKSAADIKTYTSCGDLKAENIKSAEATPAAPEKTADVTPKSTSVIYSASGFSPKTKQ